MLLEGRCEGGQQCGKAQGCWGAPRAVLLGELMLANLRMVEVQFLWNALSEHPSWLGTPPPGLGKKQARRRQSVGFTPDCDL